MVKAETRITQAILAWLVANGGDGYHVHGNAFQRSGEPDIDGHIYDKRDRRWLHLKLEVKTPEGSPSDLQIVRLKAYHQVGYIAGIVTSVADVEALLWVYYISRYNIIPLKDVAAVTDLHYWKELYA